MGNAVPRPTRVSAVRLASAERIDFVVEMNNPGVWIMGETRKVFRDMGMGVIVEYANHPTVPKWIKPCCDNMGLPDFCK